MSNYNEDNMYYGTINIYSVTEVNPDGSIARLGLVDFYDTYLYLENGKYFDAENSKRIINIVPGGVFFKDEPQTSEDLYVYGVNPNQLTRSIPKPEVSKSKVRKLIHKILTPKQK